MTRKHFRELAEILELEHRDAATAGEHRIVDRITEEIALQCKRDNPRFDRARFLEAAGHRAGREGSSS